jgi:hypothetical protein
MNKVTRPLTCVMFLISFKFPAKSERNPRVPGEPQLRKADLDCLAYCRAYVATI